jgi:hypothetical protein
MFKRRPDPEPVTRAEWWHQNHVEWPLNRTLLAAFPDLEVYGRKPATVAMDYRDPASEGVVFRYPPWFHATAGFRQQVVDLIASRLGINDPVAIWRTSGAQPCVVVKARAKLPGVVRWAEVKDLIKAAPDTAPVLGLGLGGTLIDADLEDDSPHILISAGSGGGKSALTRLIAAQALHHGGQVVILDFKRTSHNWAKQLSGVTYCRRIEEIHDALVVLAGIAEERNEAAEDPDAEIGPRIWVIFEELNAASEMLRDWWAMTREKDSPKRSPAITALKHLLFMGRSARVHVVAIAQRLDAQLVGGGSGRENFAALPHPVLRASLEDVGQRRRAGAEMVPSRRPLACRQTRRSTRMPSRVDQRQRGSSVGVQRTRVVRSSYREH